MAQLAFSDRVLSSLGKKLDGASKKWSDAERTQLKALVILGLANAQRLKELKLPAPRPSDIRTFADAFATQKLARSTGSTIFGNTNPGQSCMQRCLDAPQTTFAQCLWWCTNRVAPDEGPGGPGSPGGPL